MSEQFVPEDAWITRELLEKQWIPALESGFYKQARRTLNNKRGGFCCLGVLLDIISPDAWEDAPVGLSRRAVNLEEEVNPAYEYSEVASDGALHGFLRDDFDYTINWDFAAMVEAAKPFIGADKATRCDHPNVLLMAVNDDYTGSNDYSAPLAVIKAGLHLD